MAGNNRQIAVIPINYKDRELALSGELIMDDEGNLFSKLEDGTVKPIKGEQINFLMDLFKHIWHIGENESLDYDLANWIKTGTYDPSIEYDGGSILLKEFYLDGDGEELERWRAVSPITHLGHVIVNEEDGKTLRELFDEELAEGFISMDYRINDGDLQYVSDNVFSIVGDWTELFEEKRKLKMITNTNEEVYSLVTSSSFDGSKTNVELKDGVLENTITEVLYSIIPPGESGPTSDIDIHDKISSFLKSGHNVNIEFLSSEERLEISSTTNTEEVRSAIGSWIQDGGSTSVEYDEESQTLKISSVNTQRSDADINGLIKNYITGDKVDDGGDLSFSTFPIGVSTYEHYQGHPLGSHLSVLTMKNNDNTGSQFLINWNEEMSKPEELYVRIKDDTGEDWGEPERILLVKDYDDLTESLKEWVLNVAKASDADTLDGKNSTQFLRSDEDDTMNAKLTMNGLLKMMSNIDLTGHDLVWDSHSDGARITFINPSDSDETYMLFETSDNYDEYFKWGHRDGETFEEWMRLTREALNLSGDLNVTGTVDAPKVLGAWYNNDDGGGGDVAELYPYNKDFEFEAGDVIITNSGVCEKTDDFMSPKVIGVYSDTYHKLHLLGGNPREIPEDYDSENYLPIGIVGKVLVKVTGNVKEHDLLTTSEKLGYATSIDRNKYIPGTVFAKALESNNGEDKRIWATIMMT